MAAAVEGRNVSPGEKERKKKVVQGRKQLQPFKCLYFTIKAN